MKPWSRIDLWAAVCLLLCAAGVHAQNAAAQEPITCDRWRVAGRVTDGYGDFPLPGASVTVRWIDVARPTAHAVADRTGRFSICAPPDAAEAIVWAGFGDHSSPQKHVAPATGAPVAIALSIRLESRPAARIVGRVFDADTRDPIAAAAIELSDAITVATTDSRGNFIVTGIRPGRHRLRIRHLGHGEIEQEIEAQSGRTLELQIGLTRDPLELEPIVVTAVRDRKLEIRGFYERRYWHELLSLGTFYTQKDIERRRPLRISHMIADAAGVRMRCAGSGIRGCQIENRVGCELNAYLDGINLRVGGGRGSLDELVLPVEVAGIEIYSGAAQLPAEYAGSDSQCGAIVIWTR